MQQPEQLIDVLDTFYEDEPKVGQVVMVRHNFENTNIAGEVVALERIRPHRGYDPTGDYEVVVYHAYKLKFAGLRSKWLTVGEEENWTLVTILTDKEYHKLNPDVVLPRKVDEVINNSKPEDDNNEL
jgi:hypothetical protein